jgi:hypothetical protein
LTVREHLELFARIKGIEESQVNDVVKSLIELMDLVPFEFKRAGTLSGGNKRKLSVAIALIGEPPVVFLGTFTELCTIGLWLRVACSSFCVNCLSIKQMNLRLAWCENRMALLSSSSRCSFPVADCGRFRVAGLLFIRTPCLAASFGTSLHVWPLSVRFAP